MILFNNPEFRFLCSEEKLNLYSTLKGGQCFSWNYDTLEKVWSNVIYNIPIKIYQDKELIFISTENWVNLDYALSICIKYFRLDDIKFDLHFQHWQDKYPEIFNYKSSLRLLDQEPIEALFSFICSQNNNINRIEKMVSFLKNNFGEKINDTEFRKFPSIFQLTDENIYLKLKEAKFGYRAKFIYQAARFLHELGFNINSDFEKVQSLLSRDEKIDFLLSIPGVGPKVADCIALTGFNDIEIIPIDRHMFTIASRFIKNSTTKVSLSNYRYTQQKLEKIFGEYAGWAHLYIFAFQRLRLAKKLK